MVNMRQNANLEDYLKLTKNQQEYVQLKAEEGWTDAKIAEEIDVNRSTISRWKKDAKFLKGQQGYQSQYLKNHVPKAMRKMIDLLDAKSELVAFQASKDILDRAGFILADEDLDYRAKMNLLDLEKKKAEIEYAKKKSKLMDKVEETTKESDVARMLRSLAGDTDD